MYRFGLLTALLVVLQVIVLPVRAEVSVVDVLGNPVVLEKPAQRVVSLAPHLTEQIFSAGAGDRLVGVVSYSDYPAEATKLPVIGSYEKISYESLVGLQPDLVLAWESGNGPEILKRLRELNLTVYISEPRSMPDIAKSIADIAVLTGHQQEGRRAADQFLQKYQELVENNKTKEPVSVFYQLWHQPMMTTNKKHIISSALDICGGVNIFADALPLIPKINVESVVRRNPEVIIASGMGNERPEWLDGWLQWPGVRAVKAGALYSVPPDLLHRHTVRILQGVELMCDHFDDARERLGTASGQQQEQSQERVQEQAQEQVR